MGGKSGGFGAAAKFGEQACLADSRLATKHQGLAPTLLAAMGHGIVEAAKLVFSAH